ncbi:competence protein ComE [Fischerella thermalis CCMEE 5268]|uniref:Competence protein ComE n=2 Tax=Fischerella thermalis TaxID=372787 RepID=A0A2N6LK30_9CYAN|nr:competence protein ComE [Fischerella thermalis]PLZ98641.1 competence protein ComE [Fischerella thermalis CCMEE 5268]PMB25042.1 competence protein ComE [Fischerella thermalis CCMEE 5318]
MSNRKESESNGKAHERNIGEKFTPLGGGEYMEESSGNPVEREEIVKEDKDEKGNGSGKSQS